MIFRPLALARRLGATIACAISFASGTTRALSCDVNAFAAPQDGATDVPTNTLLWSYTGASESTQVRLVGPTGEVGLEQRSLPVVSAGPRFVLRPIEELAPQSRYTVELTSLGPDGTPYLLPDGTPDRSEIHFTTGAGPDLTAPAPPRLLSSEPSVYMGWQGVERGVELRFEEHAGILMGEAGGASGTVTELEDLLLPLPPSRDSETDAGDRTAALEARVAELEALLNREQAASAEGGVTWVTLDSVLSVGPGVCSVWPGGTRVEGRFAVLDLAGNVSEWLEGVELALPSDEQVQAFVEAANRAAAADAEGRGRASLRGRSGAGRGCQLGASGSGATSTPEGAGLPFVAAVAVALARRRKQLALESPGRAAPGRKKATARRSSPDAPSEMSRGPCGGLHAVP